MDAGSLGEDGNPRPQLSGEGRGPRQTRGRWGGWGPPSLGAQGCCLCHSRRLDGCQFDPTNGADLAWSLRKNTQLKTLMLRRGCLESGKPCAPVVAPQLERLS